MPGARCGCGREVLACDVWTSVLVALQSKRSGLPVDANRMQGLQQRYTRGRQTWKLTRRREATLFSDPRFREYLETFQDLYASVAEATGSQVIVDSSKRPSGGAVLHLMPRVDPYVVHLVRDPRAVAYSWGKRTGMGTHGVVRSTMSWDMWNLGGAAVRRRGGKARSMVLRYESFMRDPAGTLSRIVEMVGAGIPHGQVISERGTAELGTHHTVSGNTSRFKTGRIRLRLDDVWLEKMVPRKKFVCTALSLPLLRTYGYPVLPGRKKQGERVDVPRD